MFPKKWREEVVKKVEDKAFWTKGVKFSVKIVIVCIYWVLKCVGPVLWARALFYSFNPYASLWHICYYYSHFLMSNWSLKRLSKNFLKATQLIGDRTLAQTQVCLISEPVLSTTKQYFKKEVNIVRHAINALVEWRRTEAKENWTYECGCLLMKKGNFSSDVVAELRS